VIIFKHEAEQYKNVDFNLILIGNIFMKKYYVVYDMSPLEHDKNWIQIGIGEQNFDFLAGSQHYDPSSQIFSPEDKLFDSSDVMDGRDDIYQDPSYPGNKRDTEDPDGWIPSDQVDDAKGDGDEKLDKEDRSSVDQDQEIRNIDGDDPGFFSTAPGVVTIIGLLVLLAVAGVVGYRAKF
jgi:hypothetical protein